MLANDEILHRELVRIQTAGPRLEQAWESGQRPNINTLTPLYLLWNFSKTKTTAMPVYLKIYFYLKVYNQLRFPFLSDRNQSNFSVLLKFDHSALKWMKKLLTRKEKGSPWDGRSLSKFIFVFARMSTLVLCPAYPQHGSAL